jgi:hypothetical protein
MTRTCEVSVAVARPEDVFAAPSANPLAPDFAASTGIERILAGVAALTRRERARATLVVRVTAGDADASEGIAAGLRRYAGARRPDLVLRQRALRREGLQTLWLALAFIAVCLLLSALLRLAQWEGAVADLFRGGLEIAGWVALWRPLDLLLFDTWLLRREKRVLDAVATMPLRVERVPVA